MSRARDIADLGGSTDAGGITGRNLIINGEFSVFQRGTSFTSQTGVAYHADRFETQAYNVGTGVYKAEQSTEAPDGFYNSLKYSCTTADTSQDANNQFYIQQQIEAQNIYHLKFYEANSDSVTISFYVRSNTTGSYGMTLKLSDNNSSDSNVGTRVYPTTFTISSADTWEKITKTITLDSSTSETRPTGNNFGMALVIWLAAGSNRQGATANAWAGNGNATTAVDADDFLGSTSNNFHLAGVQLEVGETATSFEHESYDETLLKCARYCYRISAEVSSAYLATGMVRTNVLAWVPVWLPAPLRSGVTADLTLTDGGTFRIMEQGTSQTSTSITLGTSFRESILLVVTVASGLAAGDCVVFRHNASTSFIQIDCEL